MKIKTKITISLCITVTLIIFTVLFVNNKMSHDLISKRIYEREAPAIAASIAEKFDKEMAKAYSVARLIADNPMVHQWLLSGESEKQQKEVGKFLKIAQEQGIDFSFIISNISKKYYTDKGVRQTISRDNLKDRWYFATLDAGEKESLSIDPSKVDNGLMAFINIVMGSPQKPLGVAGVGISLNTLSQKLTETKLTPGGTTYMIDQQGTIKAHPDRKILHEIQNINRITDGEYAQKVVPRLLENDKEHLHYTNKEGEDIFVISKKIPSTGWKIVLQAKTSELKKDLDEIRNISFIILLGSILLLIIILNILTSAILKPVDATMTTLQKVSKGDMTQRINISSGDEMGQLASHFNLFMNKIHEMVSKISETTQEVDLTSKNIVTISRILADKSESTQTLADQTASDSRQAQEHMKKVAEDAEIVSSNIGELAHSAEEMTETLENIVNNTIKTNQSTTQAVDVAQMASKEVAQLEKAAVDIHQVVDAITDISEQVDLLALNATIEAARAGDAGKGFAVVASEIKELARQTNEATEDIKNRTDGIRNSTNQTGNSMERLSKIIQEANNKMTDIAAAAKEQLVSTRNTTNNIQEIYSSTNTTQDRVSSSIAEITEIADKSREITKDTDTISQEGQKLQENAQILDKSSGTLNDLIKYFTI